MNKARYLLRIVIVCFILMLILVLSSQHSYANDDKVDVSAQIAQQQSIKDNAHGMAEHARALGMPETCETITKAKAFWHNADIRQAALYDVAAYRKCDVYYISRTMYKEANGSPTMEIAGVGWCILNRLDAGSYGNSIKDITTAPNQFAYSVYTDGSTYYNLAIDVLTRWCMEKHGCTNAGRVLPADYLWFSGNGKHNLFRNTFNNTGAYWNWSYADPYVQVVCP